MYVQGESLKIHAALLIEAYQLPDLQGRIRRMRSIFFSCFTSMILSACAFIPIQHTTVSEPSGGSVTCTQRGAGIVSFWVGKYKYDTCMEDAKVMGDGLSQLIGQPLSAAIKKLGYPNDKSMTTGTDTVYVWEKDGCTIKAGTDGDGRISQADYNGDHSDCKSYRNALAQP
jgi:hypothetical protein